MTSMKKQRTNSGFFAQAAMRLSHLHPLTAIGTLAKRVLHLSEHFNTLYSAITTLLALFGTSLSVGVVKLDHIPLASAPLPIRLIIYFVIALGLGWMLGVITNRSRSIVSHARFPTIALGALLLSWLVAGPVGWLFPAQANSMMQHVVPIIILLGTMAALRVAAIHFDSGFGAASIAETRIRSGVMAVFAMGSVPVIILTAMGVQ